MTRRRLKITRSKKKVVIKNSKQKNSPSVQNSKCDGRNDFFQDAFFDMDKMEQFLSNIAKKYPSRVQVQTVGCSNGNKPIFLVRIADETASEEPKLATFIEAGSNGCDLYSVSAALYLINSLAKSNSLLMDYLIMPCLNPDAYVSVLKQEESTKIPLSLSNNYPVTLGLTNMKLIRTDTFLHAIGKWKDNQEFDSKECAVLMSVINTYQFTIRLFVSLQEEGESIVYPYGFSAIQSSDLENLKKIAKSGQMGIKRRCFNVGSIYEVCGLTFGTVIDFLKLFQNSVRFAYVIHMNRKVRAPDPKNILSYSEDIANAIKLMTKTVYMIYRREHPHRNKCDNV